MTVEALHKLFLDSEGITTDTRNLKKGAIFFALKGANFNGNEFASQAINEGCKLAIVDEQKYANGSTIIVVTSVLQTLQKLANFHRKQFAIPVIGITGSNGKTTTKELAGAVLEKKYKTLVTKGNLNNHLGVPFTLLRLTEEHEVAIIEMGANKPGDIKELVDIAEPTHGIISNVGAAHVEGFGSLEGVIKTKTELYDFIAKNDGELFININDEILMDNAPKNVSLFTYGEKNGEVTGKLIKLTPFVMFSWETETYQSPVLATKLIGKYNFINFLSAIAIGLHFNVDENSINDALSEYSPSNNRSQVTQTNRNTLIVDCYNANPTSMMAALQSFNEIEGDNKVCIVGDMLELGDISESEHQRIVDYLATHHLNSILIGDEMRKTKTNFLKYNSWSELSQNEPLEKWKGKLVLLKGSRGIRLEELISFL